MDRLPLFTASSSGSIRVAECWADLTRALTLYPETNSRVLQSLAAFLEILRETLDKGRRIEVGFSARAVWVDDTSHELNPDSNLGWLKERLEKGGLSGAVFSETVDENSLIRFTKQLLELYTRRDLSLGFEELWPEKYRGIALLEKRFDGAFADRHDEEGVEERPSIAGRTRRMEETLGNALSKDERIRRRIDQIQEKILTAAEERQELSSIDLIGSIVELLPEEALNNYQTAVDLTMKVLETVEQQLAKGNMLAELGSLEDDSTFRRLLFLISRTHFNRIDPGKRPDRVELPGEEENEREKEKEEPKKNETVVRAGDEKIGDDLDALLREMEELAPLEMDLLRTEDLEDLGEQLGVYLHYLVRLESPGRIVALQEGLRKLLESPDNDMVGVLREYLEPLASNRSLPDDLHLSRVAMWLRKHGRRDLLKRCGVLTAEWVCREFPEEFLVYVQTLDLDDQLDVAELNNVCGAIGAERFRAASDVLAGASDFLDGPLPPKLFRQPLAALTPFLQQIFERRKRVFKEEFAGFLRAAMAKPIDQKILEITDGSRFLLAEYLIAVAEGEEKKLQEQRLSILYSFIVATDADASRISQRERAIKLLANFDRPHVRTLLQRLATARKYLILWEQPRKIRKAAAAVLQSFETAARKRHV